SIIMTLPHSLHFLALYSPLLDPASTETTTTHVFPYSTLFRTGAHHQGGFLYRQNRASGTGSDRPSQGRHVRAGKRGISENSKYPDRKSTRLNSSHVSSSYAAFCLKKKNETSAKASEYTGFYIC